MEDHEFNIVESSNKQEVLDLANELCEEVLDETLWEYPIVGANRIVPIADCERIRRAMISMAAMLKHYAKRDAGVNSERP